jgi:hypothetical protein
MTETASDMKQTCLDLSNAALALFDCFDELGIEAAWIDDTVLVILDMERAHDRLRDLLSRQTAARMAALGYTPEQLARETLRQRANVGGREAK